MSFIRTLVFILFAGKIIFAQQVYFCKSVTPDGKPVEHKTNWEVKSATPVVVLLDYKKQINSSMVYLFVDRKSGNDYEAYDSKAVSADKNASTIIQPYNFKESGNYLLYFINNSGERLAQGNLIVKVTEKPVVENIKQEEMPEAVILKAEIIFCEKIVSNKPVNIKESVSLKNGGNITVFIKSDNVFNANSLTVNIYRKKNISVEEMLETKKFKVQPSWRNIFFKYKFEIPGVYKFSVYDEFNNIMKSESIIVNQ